MTQEDKQLLLKDLCARLPYGVKMRYKNDSGYEVLCQIDTFYKDVDGFCCLLRTTGPYGGFQDLNELKPYLRPMSSMTEEELKELNDKYGSIAYFFLQEPPYYHGLQAQHSDIGSIEISEFSEIYDWLNAHHFDYRIDPSTGKTLIESDLALEAPEGMYKTE